MALWREPCLVAPNLDDFDEGQFQMTGERTEARVGRVAKAASRTLDILEFVGRQPLPVSMATIAAACGIPRSSLRELLHMLQERGYVVYRSTERGWASGQRMFGLRSDALEFEHGIAVLELFGGGGGGLAVEDIVARSRLSREMVGRILTVLAGFGLVVPGPDSTYGLGRRLLGLASRVGGPSACSSRRDPFSRGCVTRVARPPA